MLREPEEHDLIAGGELTLWSTILKNSNDKPVLFIAVKASAAR